MRESLGVLAPVELAAVDDDASDCGSVAPDPLGSRVYHDVRAVIDWPAEITASTESVVHHDRHALLVRHFHNGLEVWDVVPWITYALDVDCLGLIVDQLIEVLGFVAFGKFGSDAETGVEHLELVVGSAVEIRG